MATDVPVPESLDFTAAAIKKAAMRKGYRAGIYCKWIVTDAGKTVNKNGHLVIQRKVKALRDPDDANSTCKPTLFADMYMPRVNKNHPGHKAPDTLGLIIRDLHAMFPEEVPTYPQRQGEALVYKGEEIEKGDEEACRDEVNEAVSAKLNDLWANPGQLVGMAFWATYDVNKKDPQYKNLDHITPEQDMELAATEAGQLVDEGEDDEGEADAPTKSNGKPKAAAKGKRK